MHCPSLQPGGGGRSASAGAWRGLWLSTPSASERREKQLPPWRSWALQRAQAELWGSEMEATHRPKEAGGWRCHSCQDTHSVPLGYCPCPPACCLPQLLWAGPGPGARYFPHSDAVNITLLFVAAVKLNMYRVKYPFPQAVSCFPLTCQCFRNRFSSERFHTVVTPSTSIHSVVVSEGKYNACSTVDMVSTKKKVKIVSVINFLPFSWWL